MDEFKPRVILRAAGQYIDRLNFEDFMLLKFAPYGQEKAEWSQRPSVRHL